MAKKNLQYMMFNKLNTLLIIKSHCLHILCMQIRMYVISSYAIWWFYAVIIQKANDQTCLDKVLITQFKTHYAYSETWMPIEGRLLGLTGNSLKILHLLCNQA